VFKRLPPPVEFEVELLAPKRSWLRIGLSILTFVAVVLILGYLLYQQRDILLGFDWQINWSFFLLSFLIFGVDLALVAFIWGWILNSLGKQLPFRTHFHYYCISNVAKRIPGTIWYIASRVTLYSKEGIELRKTSFASGMEAVISTIASAVVSLMFAVQILRDYSVSPLLLAGILLLGGILVHPRMLSFFFRRLKIDASELHYKHIIQWLFIYSFVWIIGGVLLFAIINILYDLPTGQLGYVIGSWSLVGFLSSLLLFSPSNLGVTEVGLSILLSAIMPSSIAVVIAIFARILLILYEIIWAGLSYSLAKSPN
jgi:uncharacterized membrane protein YbhN (UPF0104 family)